MLPEIELLLRQKIGLEAASLGSSAIARSVRQSMAECGISDAQAYLARLQTSPQQLEALIENIVVPETWFFRDREPFAYLSRYVMSEWLTAHPGRVLRVLSIPCSTGEEPYSIAIALLEAGFASKNFHIDAVDISKRALLKAKRAIYDKHSFRGTTLALRERYFTQTSEGYQLCEWIKNTVTFIHGNLLDPYFLIEKAHYDIIFCRNLLIYLDSAARKRAMAVLERLLAKKGLLFVGHSETGQLFASQFVSVRHPLAFAYRKAEKQINRGTGIQRSKGAEDKKNLYPPFPTSLPAQVPACPPPPLRPSLPPSSLLETARSLADRGQLDEAAKLCETYLSQNCVSVEAYFLLGEVRQAAGNEEQAEQCFQKVIYLEPNHYEALMHLALLKENRGDLASVAILRQRIQRLQKS